MIIGDCSFNLSEPERMVTLIQVPRLITATILKCPEFGDFAYERKG
jgi:hypothetical protein